MLPFNNDLYNEMFEAGYVNKTKHPNFDLYIYNYTALAQFDRIWNEVTLNCRGLIINGENKIVARPFQKFFNYGEMDVQLPIEDFEVYEKIDGSLGILYWHDEEAYIATRGSFISDQAKKATEILNSKYAQVLENIDRNKTYLFEIIYPQNRIVVDYGDTEDIILLAIIDNVTGKDVNLVDIGFPLVKRYNGLKDFEQLKSMNTPNAEGFIIKYSNGFRLKLKFEEYLRIHKIVTNVSSKVIWDYLKNNIEFDKILESVPDEFYKWVKASIANFKKEYEMIEMEARAEFKKFDTRKETAEYFLKCKYPAILFKILDGQSYEEIIWKLLKPEYERPFSNRLNDEE